MEMYAQVNRKFKQQYGRQEHMKTFKTYDRLEVSNTLTSLTYDYLKSDYLGQKKLSFPGYRAHKNIQNI